MMIFTVIHQQYLTHHDFAEIFEKKFGIFFWNFFSLKTHEPTVPAYVKPKKSVKRVTNSILIIIAGVLLKDFTTVDCAFKKTRFQV
jgi:hypothetical protein